MTSIRPQAAAYPGNNQSVLHWTGWPPQGSALAPRGQNNNPVQAIRNLARWLFAGPESSVSNLTLVRSVKEVNGTCHPWERRILDLADGNSPEQVADLLYRDLLAKGAHLVDIGIWRNLFRRSIEGEIGQLVSAGYLSIRDEVDQSWRGTND